MSATTQMPATHAPVSFSSGAAMAYQVHAHLPSFLASPASCSALPDARAADAPGWRIRCLLASGKRCARAPRNYTHTVTMPARLPPLTSCAPLCICFFLPLPCSPRRRQAVRGESREATRRGDPHGSRRMHQHRARLTPVSGLPPVSRLFGVRGMQRVRASRRPGLRAATARQRGPRGSRLVLASGFRGLGSQWARP
jgi:hypothetical protein